MALVTHQLQGSYAIFPTRLESRNRTFESKHIGRTVSVVGRTDRFISLRCKCKPCFRAGAPLFLGTKASVLKITSFKGTGQSDESSGRVGSKYVKDSGKLSYVQQGSEETLTELPKVQDASSATGEPTKGSQAIQDLFRNWLTLLRTPSPNQVVDEALEEPSAGEISETQNEMQRNGRSEILKAVWYSFWGLDAMIKIPFLIFIPLYLAINIFHGAEVSKELTPLWVLGPLIVAVYVKMFWAICALYVFAFKLTIKIVKDMPTNYAVVREVIAKGKIKEVLGAVLNIKNLDYKKVSKRMLKDFNEWLIERYLDFIESIWPTYCRTIRFLKRANLI